MKIVLLSADLKLTDSEDPSKRGFKILEFNDGLKSGFRGYDALGGDKMLTGRIASDYQNLFPQFRLMDLNGHGAGDVRDDRKPLFIQRSDGMITYVDRNHMIAAQRMNSVYQSLNDDLHIRALSDNKAYQYYMAQQMGDNGLSLFPSTTILPTDYRAARQDGRITAEPAKDYVLKPLTFVGGNGIRLIEGRRFDTDLPHYLTYRRYDFRQQNWIGLSDPACIVQERVAPNKVEAKDGIFDGTMRVVFTLHGQKGAGLDCHIHDAYWKLPLKPMEDGKDLDTIVSFSPSNNDSAHKKYKPDPIKEAYFTETQPARIQSMPVEGDVKSWLFPQLAAGLNGYFNFVTRESFMDHTIALMNHETQGRRTLGMMLATHAELYPAMDNNKIDTHYPQHLMDAMIGSKLMQSGKDHAFYKLEERISNRYRVNCENSQAEFTEPLRSALKEAAMRKLVSVAIYSIRHIPRVT